MYACPLGHLKRNARGSVAVDPNGWEGTQGEGKSTPTPLLGFRDGIRVVLLKMGLMNRDSDKLCMPEVRECLFALFNCLGVRSTEV